MYVVYTRIKTCERVSASPFSFFLLGEKKKTTNKAIKVTKGSKTHVDQLASTSVFNINI